MIPSLPVASASKVKRRSLSKLASSYPNPSWRHRVVPSSICFEEPNQIWWKYWRRSRGKYRGAPSQSQRPSVIFMRNLCEYLIYGPSTSMDALRASAGSTNTFQWFFGPLVASVPQRANRLAAKGPHQRYNRTLAVFGKQDPMPGG